jgi:hypothetical protein
VAVESLPRICGEATNQGKGPAGVSAVETGRFGIPPPVGAAARRFRALAVLTSAGLVVYLLGAALGAPTSVLSPYFSVFMLPVPFVVWWAYTKAPPELRRLILLLAWAATLWLLGSLVWYAYYFAEGSTIPEPPGPWDGPLVLARLLVIVAIVVAMQTLISFRIAILDAWVMCAATIALGAAFVWHGLADGVSAASLFTLNRPLLGIVTLVLLASAALGSWQGLPFSIVLMGLGEVALTIGSLIYSYQAVQDAYVDDRWAGLAWATGAGLSILAASTIILGIDRRVSIGGRARIPKHPAGSRAVLLVSLTALVLSVAVAGYGLLEGSGALTLIGLFASVSIGVAMGLRARDSIRTAEDAYTRLDQALAESERTRDQLTTANEDLARANLELRTMHIAMADLLNLADERTEGRMRELIEDTGSELAELLDEEIGRSRGS